MKVSAGDEPVIAQPEKMGRQERAPHKEFAVVLKRAVRNLSEQALGEQNAARIQSAPKIELSPSLTRPSGLERVESFLNLLEQYQWKLANSKVPLKDISPLVDEMETEGKRLIPVMESLPEKDPFREILKGVLITSSVEVMKFRRGDYEGP